MRVKKRGKWRQILFLCAVLFLWESVVRRDHEVDLCRMQTVCAATTLKTGTQSELATSQCRRNPDHRPAGTDQFQDIVDVMLGDKTFSVTDTFHRLLSGEDVLSEEERAGISAQSLFFRALRGKKPDRKTGVTAVICSCILRFCRSFDNGQIGEISFYVVYLLVFTLMMNSFSRQSESLIQVLGWITEFMKELSPVYFMAVAAASGASTAAVFYQGILLLVWLFQWLLESVLLPGVSLYILLKFVNHLSREEMLGKMAELIETLISWGCELFLVLWQDCR